MKKYELVRLRSGEIIQVPVERLEPSIVYPQDYEQEQEYQRPALHRPQTIRAHRRREPRRASGTSHPIFMACVLFAVGFLSCGISGWFARPARIAG